ncbi:hypothetical protein LCGC14_2713220, partial [marine sediment metagenome]
GKPTDFELVMSRYVQDKMFYFPITESFTACLERAMIILANELDKRTDIELNGTKITFKTSAMIGDTKDIFVLRKAKLKGGPKNLRLNTDLVLRAVKNAEEISFGDNAVAFRDSKKRFCHIVANVVEGK